MYKEQADGGQCFVKEWNPGSFARALAQQGKFVRFVLAPELKRHSEPSKRERRRQKERSALRKLKKRLSRIGILQTGETRSRPARRRAQDHRQSTIRSGSRG
jgi:hypothetical protein